MSLGRRKTSCQPEFWIASSEVVQGPGHPFYSKLNEVLSKHGFDEFVEERCAPFYHESRGRPSIPPGVYFRMLLIGQFEGIDSERGIARQAAFAETGGVGGAIVRALLRHGRDAARASSGS